MKKFLTIILIVPFFFSCSQPSNKGNAEDRVGSQTIRDMQISFMGIQVGAPNGSEVVVMDSSALILKTNLPESFRYLGSSNRSLFDNPSEKTLNTFFASIVDNQDEKHNGWGIIKSDCDSITTIHFIIPNCQTDVVYERMQELFIELYGQPDSSYVEGEDLEMKNTLCYWNFSNDKRITLNKCQFLGHAISDEWERLFKTYERVEIAYQDMKAVYRHEAAEKAKTEEENLQRMQNEEERKSENRKVRARQQL